MGALLQGVLQQLLDMGVVSTLTEDLQWNIRMLLPRQVCAWMPPLPGTRHDMRAPCIADAFTWQHARSGLRLCACFS